MIKCSEKRSKIMRAVKSKDTSPEMIVRKLIFSLGYRYRLHYKNLPGKPDIVFPTRKKVVFVHGCFWHSHTCKRGDRIPKVNRDYWIRKIQSNAIRDKKNVKSLEENGWKVMVIWECEIKEIENIKNKLITFLDE
ncbi:MAG: very short patch repair endonuclease [Thermodesulfobacteriota bacterium]